MSMTDSGNFASLNRTIQTPEAVPIRVMIAPRSERAAAFIIDFVFQVLLIIVFFLAVIFGASQVIPVEWLLPLMTFVLFLIRIFYFPYFELSWQGQTPGKRIIGIKVIDRYGGHLTPEAILTRNFMREIEVFLPLSVLGTVAFNTGGLIMISLLTIWVLIFMLMPLFNRDALRVGDLVAGTLVVRAPRPTLLPDLAEAGPAKPDEQASPYQFTHAQLGIYGVKELQVLEDVLRHTGQTAEAMQAEVANRIQRKIDWDRASVAGYSDRAFLEEFYRALRRHLERGMLFGRRKEDKTDGEA